MKHFILLTALLSVGLISCKKKGCTDPTAVNYSSEAKKDDGTCNYIPTILVTGPATLTVSVGDTYTDQGATATNKDGSVVTVATDLSQVSTATVGTFTVTYTATNEFGTATATRTVNVVISQDNWLGSPTVTTTCSATLFPLSNSPTVAAGSSTTSLVIGNMFNLVGGSVNATINGQTITIPQQTVGITIGDIILSGTGTMNANGTSFTVNYDFENTTPVVGGTGSCTATYAL
jgi:hypothetical protein